MQNHIYMIWYNHRNDHRSLVNDLRENGIFIGEIMEAEIKLVEGLTTVGISESNHWIPIDGARDFNGREGANKPMELMLIALGSCTAMDVLSILAKMRQPVTDLRVKLKADQQEEHPKVFTNIHLNFMVKGDVAPEKLERAITLSQTKFCPVAAMLKISCPIDWEYVIE